MPTMPANDRRILRYLVFAAIAFAAVVTIAVLNKASSGPYYLMGLVFDLWSLSPYAFLALLAKLFRRTVPLLVLLVLTVAVGGFGVWALVDSLFYSADAQSALIVVVNPVWQWALSLIAVLPLFLLNRYTGS